jgi:hypothetical protein
VRVKEGRRDTGMERRTKDKRGQRERERERERQYILGPLTALIKG